MTILETQKTTRQEKNKIEQKLIDSFIFCSAKTLFKFWPDPNFFFFFKKNIASLLPFILVMNKKYPYKINKCQKIILQKKQKNMD